MAITQNASRDPRFKLFFSLPEDRYEAFLSVPVTAKDKVIGVINVQHRKPHTHGPAEIKLISIIGQQVGSAIEMPGCMKRRENGLSKLRVSCESAKRFPPRSIWKKCSPSSSSFAQT